MKNFQIWKTGRGTTINTALVQANVANPPLDGDLIVGDGAAPQLYTFMATTGGAATALARTILGVAVKGRNPRGAINNPGRFTAATYPDEPNFVNIGGRGSRSTSFSPAGQFFMAPITADDMWVLPQLTNAGVTVGTSYAYSRVVTAGEVVATIKASDTQVVLTVLGYYSPDIDKGLAVSGGSAPWARVWVKAALPGGAF